MGVSLRVGLSRSIFPGAGRSTVSKHQTCRRAQKGYSRISLTRFASCIAARSPAIAAAQRVRSACAPEITPHLCLVAYVYLRSLPAVCAELSQACEAFLPFARSFRRRAKPSRRLRGPFAGVRNLPVVCAELSHACETFLPFARSFRTPAKPSCRLRGAFAGERIIPAVCTELSHISGK